MTSDPISDRPYRERTEMKRLALIALPTVVVVGAAQLKAMIPEQVKIDSGLISGTTSDEPRPAGAEKAQPVRVFKGIPCAAPPLGENRWKAPQPVAKWDGVRKADAFGAPCTSGPAAGRGGGRGAGGPRGGRRGRGAQGAPGAAAPAAPPAQRAPPAD